jgi:hypothetical protein
MTAARDARVPLRDIQIAGRLAFPVVTYPDRAVASFADGPVDRAACARHERVSAGLLPLPMMRGHEGHVFDVGTAGFADPEPVQPQQHGQRGVAWSNRSAVNRKRPSSPRSSPHRSVGCTVGRRTYWAGLEGIRPSTCAKQ